MISWCKRRKSLHSNSSWKRNVRQSDWSAAAAGMIKRCIGLYHQRSGGGGSFRAQTSRWKPRDRHNWRFPDGKLCRFGALGFGRCACWIRKSVIQRFRTFRTSPRKLWGAFDRENVPSRPFETQSERIQVKCGNVNSWMTSPTPSTFTFKSPSSLICPETGCV